MGVPEVCNFICANFGGVLGVGRCWAAAYESSLGSVCAEYFEQSMHFSGFQQGAPRTRFGSAFIADQKLHTRPPGTDVKSADLAQKALERAQEVFAHIGATATWRIMGLHGRKPGLPRHK